MDTRVAELPLGEAFDHSRVINKPLVEPRFREDTIPDTAVFSKPRYVSLFRFERAISFAIIVFALMTLSMIALQSLVAQMDAREARIAIQDVRSEIGDIRESLQQARAGLAVFDVPESVGTMPLEPEEVITLILPPPMR